MKNIKKFVDFGLIEEEKGNVSPANWKKFIMMMRDLDFKGAFDHAESCGIFEGGLDAYISSREEAGSKFAYLIRDWEAYYKAAEEIAEDIIEDLETSQTN